MARTPARKAAPLDLGALLPVRDGLSAGGRWIRTSCSARKSTVNPQHGSIGKRDPTCLSLAIRVSCRTIDANLSRGVRLTRLASDRRVLPPGRLVRQMPAAWCEPDQESRMVLKIERFQPEGMNVRMSGGKPSYSHVVTVSGSGKIVYTAGQLARDVDGNCVGKGDLRAQMEQTFQNLDRCLKAAGATWADVVKTNTFVTDFDEFQKCADIRMCHLGLATPCRGFRAGANGCGALSMESATKTVGIAVRRCRE